MGGRKCERCFNEKLGYCPFDFACKYEVWERFNKLKKILAIELQLLEKTYI